MPSRKPGRKSRLPPRTPDARYIWTTTKIDFAPDAVIRPLKNAGWSFDRNDIASEFETLGLHACIRDLVLDYMSVSTSERTVRLRDGGTPEKLRKAVAKLEREITKFMIQLPNIAEHAADSMVVEALNRELDKIECEAAPDLEFVRAGLNALKCAANQVRTAESGAGPPANRAALELIRGLCTIYQERTSSVPSSSPDGLFAQFVRAINDLIPEKFQIAGLDHLIAAAANLAAS
jgi:hypothetical protein